MTKPGAATTFGTDTIAVRAGRDHLSGAGVAASIELTTTFVLPGDPEGHFSYARTDSPAYQPLESALAALEGGEDAVIFSAGSAAAIAVMRECPPGSTLVMTVDAYYGLRAWALEEFPLLGVEVRQVDLHDAAALDRSLEGAALLWTESPTNPYLGILDLANVANIAAARGVPWVCDNTFATPILQHPLHFGATASVHSVTKYIGGHSDLIMGVAICSSSNLANRLRARRAKSGTQPDGFSCWLARRGLQTLPVRVRHQSATALTLAKRLKEHPMVERVWYPGLISHPGHEVAARQMRGGFGGMLSILVAGGQPAAQAVVDSCRVWIAATSLGGVESLVERRDRWKGESADPALLRLSVGLEDLEDLWRDLDEALSASAGDR
ncbi:MAG: PLP-dependent aspartate aminotransferase family protein [Chloroflexota bacterium]|nr:PLP-dependent aspartate aminotransferase family protein [Chloroflexota bacterium]